jgi:hypothetical protein
MVSESVSVGGVGSSSSARAQNSPLLLCSACTNFVCGSCGHFISYAKRQEQAFFCNAIYLNNSAVVSSFHLKQKVHLIEGMMIINMIGQNDPDV